MVDRRRYLIALGSLALGTWSFGLPGCDGGDGTPQGKATPNEFLDVDESGSPPDAGAKAAKKKPR